MKKVICILLSVVLLLGILSACTKRDTGIEKDDNSVAVEEDSAEQGEQSAAITGSLQSFNAVLLDGGGFTPADFAKYDVTVINFWGTYCGPCINEMPELAAFNKEKPANVNFITYCTDGFDSREAAKSILKEAGLEAPVIISADGDFEAVLNQIMCIPTTLFVDSSGKIVGTEIIGGVEDVKAEYYSRIAEVLGT